jgi:hypothetical protein
MDAHLRMFATYRGDGMLVDRDETPSAYLEKNVSEEAEQHDTYVAA